MNIMYCGDKGIEDGVLLSILSLKKHTKSPLDIYLLTFGYETKKRKFTPITTKFTEGLKSVLGADDRVHLYDLSREFMADPPTANLSTRFTPGCMLRLYCDLIPELPDKILYLDNDVLAHGDPSSFYDTALGDHELAGVLDNYGGRLYQRNLSGSHKEYLNSGVLLLNMKKLRETQLFSRVRALCRVEKIFMPDQTSINRLCGSKLILDRRFNEQVKTKEDTIFRHFTTTIQLIPYPHPQTIKPWHISDLHDKLKEYDYDDILSAYQSIIKEIKDV